MRIASLAEPMQEDFTGAQVINSYQYFFLYRKIKKGSNFHKNLTYNLPEQIYLDIMIYKRTVPFIKNNY
jgi:hypothetical protein